MKVLWLTNIALPEASNLMNKTILPLGGWLVNASKELSHQRDINLTIAFPSNEVKTVKKIMGEKITYFAFAAVTNESDSSMLEQILNETKPDIVHVFGTEFIHTLIMINLCNDRKIKSVISIQGLVSIIAQHYLIGLPALATYRFTFRDLIKRDNIIQQKNKYSKRGVKEVKALKMVENVIGRTTWDKACSTQINPGINYYFCNETLRSEFYNNIWKLDECEPHSIFVSQASYTIKGLHFLLQALPLVLKNFLIPNCILLEPISRSMIIYFKG